MIGITLMSEFTLSGTNKNFSGMIDYIDRKEAIENELNEENFSGMIGYMDREKAKHIYRKNEIGLFTFEKDFINESEKKQLKNKFDKSQSNGSIMWKDVISFDNNWLEEQGIYSKKSKLLDEKKLKSATRKAMEEMIKLENIPNALWCADIHFNTDNIHIHIVTVEEVVTRERGKRKPKTLEKMKSKIVNDLTDEKEIYKRINDIIRKDIVDSKKKVALSKDKATKELFKKAYSMLPENKKYWQYNYNSIKKVKPILNEMTNIYIEKNHKKSFNELSRMLKKQQEKSCENYGAENNYYENKMNDLYTRMGNAILKEMKEYNNVEKNKTTNNQVQNKQNSFYKRLSNDNQAFTKSNFDNQYKGTKKINLIYNLKKMNHYMNSEYDNFKNQINYEQLRNKIDFERQDYEY